MKATISGIRGVAGKDLSLQRVLKLCQNFASIIPHNKCVLGRDTRQSGDMIARTASAALMSRGINVLDMKISPTPEIFYESKKFGAGIVVTSSHNPVQWNGLKFVLNGRGISKTQMSKILEEPRAVIPDTYGTRTDHVSAYAQDVCKIVCSISRPVSVLIDAGGGAAAHAAPAILRDIGCSVDVIQGPTRPDPTTGGLQELLQASHKYDMGAAFDMDGDRLVLAMNGAIQPPDATLALGIAAMMRRGEDTFVLSRDTSMLVEEYVKRRGGEVYRSPVGEVNVVEEMIRTKTGTGGEGSSGGLILHTFNGCRDGILAAGLAALTIAEGVAPSVLRETTSSSIIRTKIHAGTGTIDYLGRRIRDVARKTDDSDGTWGMLDESSWVLVRESNTEDVIRVSAEAPDMHRAQYIVRWISDMVSNHERE